jgi:hypothetical protein
MVWSVQTEEMTPNEGAAPNAGGPRLLAIRTSQAARVGELWPFGSSVTR